MASAFRLHDIHCHGTVQEFLRNRQPVRRFVGHFNPLRRNLIDPGYWVRFIFG